MKKLKISFNFFVLSDSSFKKIIKRIKFPAKLSNLYYDTNTNYKCKPIKKIL